MKYTNQLGAIAVLLMWTAAFLPWIHIVSADITVTGLKSAGTNYGKPAYMNLFLSSIAFVLFLLPKVWAKRFNFFFCAANLAWAVRNLLILNVCYGGECPQLQSGIILHLIAASLMLLCSLFPQQKLPENP